MKSKPGTYILDLFTDYVAILFGVWIVDLGLPSIQFGWLNTATVALGVKMILNPVLYAAKKGK